MHLSLSAPMKKLLVILIVMVMSYVAFATIIESAKNGIRTGSLGSLVNSAEVTADMAKLDFEGTVVRVPAPEGYCFLEKDRQIDRIALDLVGKAQSGYQNHLWAVFVACADLEKMRQTQDLNVTSRTGLIVTPLSFLDSPIRAEAFAATVARQIEDHGPEDVDGKPEKPLIYHNRDGAVMFRMRHADPTKTTEFEIMTAIRDRPLVVIFKTSDLKDSREMEAATKSYLERLRAAN